MQDTGLEIGRVRSTAVLQLCFNCTTGTCQGPENLCPSILTVGHRSVIQLCEEPENGGTSPLQRAVAPGML